MIVADTSALIAIFLREAGWERFADALSAGDTIMGAPTAFEYYLVAARKKGSAAIVEAQATIALFHIDIALWTGDHARLAADAHIRFGGRPARLNYGDCMAYAIAKALDAPLLFKGDDFRHTDIRAALD